MNSYQKYFGLRPTDKNRRWINRPAAPSYPKRGIGIIKSHIATDEKRQALGNRDCTPTLISAIQ